MATNFSIARARGLADIDAVAALTRAYAASLSIDLGYQDFARELATLPGDYGPPQGALLLARAGDGTPLGSGALRRFDATRCEMKRLYVAPRARGQSLGRALAAALVGEARRLRYASMLLDTLPEMTAAQGLYRALGFVEIAPYYETPVAGTLFLELRL